MRKKFINISSSLRGSEATEAISKNRLLRPFGARNDGFLTVSLMVIIFSVTLSAANLEAAEKDYCIECHKTLDGSAKEPADKIEGDVHFKRGLSCSDCHGGDPTKEDFAEAKDPARGFIGKPKRNDIPLFCGKCHADPAYMRKYNPNIPTDQLAKYNESQHGKLNAKGDRKVAVCISCHGVHGIREKNDPLSPIFITNAPKACASCHADKEYMKKYNIPTNQMEEFETSVHGEALLKKGDRGAPACHSCHGSHDAALPRAFAVGNICAQCHSLTRDLFAKSPHKAAHDSLGIPECEACHGNHKIARTSDDMLGTGTGAGGVCVKCHKEDSRGYAVAGAMKSAIVGLKDDIKASEAIVWDAEKHGMEVSDTKFYLDEAKNSLTKSRAYIHTFSKDSVDQIVKEGISSADKAKDKGKKAISEFNFRRAWLAVVVAIILLLAAALYLKLRSMEKP
ncbi:MAG: cytochrome c3 family protein [Candidatus Omnitrophota bacterium]|nr:cytochrome c3 family protein [Candidatus Omnitrophota bacterium]